MTKPILSHFTVDDYLDDAIRQDTNGNCPVRQQPSQSLSGLETVDGRLVIALRNVNGLLATYVVRDGAVQRLN